MNLKHKIANMLRDVLMGKKLLTDTDQANKRIYREAVELAVKSGEASSNGHMELAKLYAEYAWRFLKLWREPIQPIGDYRT